jgi:hypothetical protein
LKKPNSPKNEPNLKDGKSKVGTGGLTLSEEGRRVF